MKNLVLGLAAAIVAVPAIGETSDVAAAQATTAPAAASAAPVAVLAPAAQESILRAGTEIPLITREELTTEKKKLRVGQRFQMEVSSNVMMNGVVVIPGGSPAVGE